MFDGLMVAKWVLLLVAATACAEPASHAPPDPVVVAQPPSPEPAPPPLARIDPFDFWLALINPELAGTEQICVATQVSALAEPERRRMAGHRHGEARRVSCQRSASRDVEAAIVVVMIPEHLDPAAVVASTRGSTVRDVETRLHVRVLGVDARGETVNAELLSVERVTQAGSDDPTPRPSRCCRHRRREEPEQEPEREPLVGFDFDHWTGHVGTSQHCVVHVTGTPRRTRGVQPEAIGIPADVIIQMYAVCQHASGQSGVRLLFTEGNAAPAQWVAHGSRVRGIIDGSGDLLVDFVQQRPRRARR